MSDHLVCQTVNVTECDQKHASQIRQNMLQRLNLRPVAGIQDLATHVHTSGSC